MADFREAARRIKELVDIVDLIGSYGVELKKRGARYWACCPFHAEAKPSFSVTQSEQFFHCFGCKKSGDVISFVRAMEGIEFPDALKMLGDRCGVVVNEGPYKRSGPRRSDKLRLFKVLEAACGCFQKNLKSRAGAGAVRYLTRRGFTIDQINRFRLGYAADEWRNLLESLVSQGFKEPDLIKAGLIRRSGSGRSYDFFRNRLVIPIFDIQGRVLGFGGRLLDGSEGPKYLNTSETEIFKKNKILYGLNLARQSIQAEKTAIVVEGYTDVIMAHQRGIANVVATLGTALTDEHAKTLRNMADRIVLLFDGDSAGMEAARRGIEPLIARDLDILIVPLEGDQDPCEFFSVNDSKVFKRFVDERGRDFFDFSIESLTKTYDLGTPGGRTRIARELFRLVAFLKDNIKRDLVLCRISQSLDIPENLIRREFASEIRKDSSPALPSHWRRGVLSSGRGKASPEPGSRAEEDLLIGLLKNTSLVDEYRERLSAVALEGDEERKILEGILDEPAPGALRPGDLLTRFEEDERAKEKFCFFLNETRRTEPRALVTGALDYFQNRIEREEYREFRKKSKDALNGEDGRVAQFLEEAYRRIKKKHVRDKEAQKRSGVEQDKNSTDM